MSLINEFKLDSNISSSSSCSIFCHVLLKFLLHVGRKIFIINDTLATKVLTRLRLSFIYQCDNKFRHGLRDKLNPLCSCSVEAEITTWYSQRCYFFNVNRDNALHKNQVFHYGFLQQMSPNPQETTDLVKFAEQILYEKLHFLCSDDYE